MAGPSGAQGSPEAPSGAPSLEAPAPSVATGPNNTPMPGGNVAPMPHPQCGGDKPCSLEAPDVTVQATVIPVCRVDAQRVQYQINGQITDPKDVLRQAPSLTNYIRATLMVDQEDCVTKFFQDTALTADLHFDTAVVTSNISFTHDVDVPLIPGGLFFTAIRGLRPADLPYEKKMHCQNNDCGIPQDGQGLIAGHYLISALPQDLPACSQSVAAAEPQCLSVPNQHPNNQLSQQIALPGQQSQQAALPAQPSQAVNETPEFTVVPKVKAATPQFQPAGN